MNRRALRSLLAFLLLLAAGARAGAAVSVYLSPEAVAGLAPVAFEGRVTSVDTGYDPVTARIATYVTLEVTRVLRGPVSLGTVVLREQGGTYGDLVHVSETAPSYAAGEEALVFAEAARDGALRTAAGFFGKFAVSTDGWKTPELVRRLGGRGLILRGPADPDEHFTRAELRAVASAESLGPAATGCLRIPAEYGRLIWNSGPSRPDPAPAAPPHAGRAPAALAQSAGAEPPAGVEFVSLSATSPARWDETDSGGVVSIDVERARNPLGNADAAVTEIGRALAAWTQVPEARAALRLGNTDARYTTFNSYSPADVYPSANIVLFGDPYDDLTDPVSCSGTLAYGGYWRSGTPSRIVNGVQYYPIRRSYVIFNRNFECFLGVAANLAEIATHEIGHGLGFGHSSVTGSIMRGWAYGDRGAVLGDDDRNAAHCVYPHTFTVTSPNGGEVWQPGTTQPIRWSGTLDGAADAGTVDIDLSTDGGATWSTIAAQTPNDGAFDWAVAGTPSDRARVRVARRTLAVAGAGAVTICSQDASNAAFAIPPGDTPPGAVADTGAGALTLAKNAAGSIDLTWGGSCGTPAGYVVYQGTLASLALGVWDHEPIQCDAGPATAQWVEVAGPDRYYLVSAATAAREGSLGTSSTGELRPESSAACHPREAADCP